MLVVADSIITLWKFPSCCSPIRLDLHYPKLPYLKQIWKYHPFPHRRWPCGIGDAILPRLQADIGKLADTGLLYARLIAASTNGDSMDATHMPKLISDFPPFFEWGGGGGEEGNAPWIWGFRGSGSSVDQSPTGE